MANNLDSGKKVMAVSMLCEGSSIRSIERMTGIHRDTIMRLGVRVGEACKRRNQSPQPHQDRQPPSVLKIPTPKVFLANPAQDTAL